jgi:hypothetical protein
MPFVQFADLGNAIRYTAVLRRGSHSRRCPGLNLGGVLMRRICQELLQLVD